MTTSDSLRVGIVGVGMMGSDHARRVASRISGARLVAVSDPDRPRAEELASGYDGVSVHDDATGLIGSDAVDAVILASPGSAHEEQLLACIEHGKPTLCEKPLTMDGDSSLRVIRAERESGRSLIQVGFMRRFDPEYAELKRLLAAGALGRLLLVHNTHRNKAVPSPEFRSEIIVRDSLVHEVDVARFLFGEEIEEITVLRPAPTSLAHEGVADPQVAIFRMSGGGIVTTEVFVNCQTGYEVRCEAVGERGTVTAGLSQTGLYTTRANLDGDAGWWGGPVAPDFTVRFGRAYDLEVQAWADAARTGTVTGPTAWDGYASTAVCSAGVESLQSGQPVKVTLADREVLS
ncbi:MAG: Gfo/Idh/MocA family oxidoreductase [Intrasporangium sp.]|uniref:Gfo/Idh/MocA family protein n=1 Tax=Intrasporangium sp. TaxID=1925024 RepID=UPI002648F872|nr:Gfo/Idh/MocA family oxidoreductase [Intrasporangium sp.]MDN5797078.1 Gfo/Idh/MocA family oxidoreductase [Intrasporangium sp.]